MLQGLLRLLLRLLAQYQISLVAVSLATAMALVSTSDLQDDLNIGACPLNLIRRQLQVAYRCQPDEFLDATACGTEKTVITCPKGRYLAVHSASRGRSRYLTECSMEVTDEADCPVQCVVGEVEAMCLGRHRCLLIADDDRFSQDCPPMDDAAQAKPNILRIRYTCVRKVVLDELRRDNGTSQMSDREHDDLCPLTSRRRGQVTPVPSVLDSLSTSISSQESKWTNRWNAMKTGERFVSSTPTAISTRPIEEADTAMPALQPKQPTDSLDDEVFRGSVSVMDQRRNSSGSLPSPLLRSISEWLWTWTFVRDNIEKSILYLLCSLCFGIILLLIAVTINLACRRRTSGSAKIADAEPIRLVNSDNSVKWRSPESESSTGDDRTFQGDDDVEVTHIGHHHHHNHHTRGQGNFWHRGANSPPSPPAAANLEPSGDLTDGTAALMNSQRVSDDEVLSSERQGTQSLPRRTAPHLWYNQDASEESPAVAVSAQTLQPTRHYHK